MLKKSYSLEKASIQIVNKNDSVEFIAIPPANSKTVWLTIFWERQLLLGLQEKCNPKCLQFIRQKQAEMQIIWLFSPLSKTLASPLNRNLWRVLIHRFLLVVGKDSFVNASDEIYSSAYCVAYLGTKRVSSGCLFYSICLKLSWYD